MMIDGDVYKALAEGKEMNIGSKRFIRHVLKQTVWLQLSSPSQKNILQSRFVPGSPMVSP